MKYQDLLKECDTGTIVFDRSGNARDKDGHTVTINPRSGNEQWVKQGELRVKLLAHSANVLPQALKVLDQIYRAALISNANNPIQRSWLIEHCKDAILAIENVNV